MCTIQNHNLGREDERMKWKKVIALFLVILTVCSVGTTTGCEKKETSEDEKNPPKAEEIFGGGAEKNYYTAEDYVKNPDLFKPAWAGKWDVPEEMTNFEEKWEQWFTPNGRLMSLIHRAENNTYYPENSIEAILSCIAAGADMVELDLCMTKDGHIVMMHDKTVARTTNVKQLRDAGAVGLPESDIITDWTLEQLRRLRLVMLKPDGTVEQTNYVIPTFEDVLMVAADKIFIMLDLDTTDYEWNYELDIYPLLKKYNAYRSVGIPIGMCASYTDEHINELIEMVKKDSGHDKVLMQFGVSESNVTGIVKMIEKNKWPKFLRAGAYNPGFDLWLAPYFGKYRVHANAILTDIEDNRANWEMLHKKGYNFIHTDYYIEMGQYIEELYFSK